MALDDGEIRLALNQNLYSAPLGTPLPTDVSPALTSPWVHAGYIGEDTASVNPTTDTAEIRAAQSVYAVRRVVTGRAFVLSLNLLQRNADNFRLAFGGGSVSTNGGVATYTPPAPEEILERAFVFEVADGLNVARFCLARGVPTLSGEVSFARADAGLDLEITSLDSQDGLWKLVTNEEGFGGDGGGS